MKCKYEGSGVWAERCMGTKEVDPCPGYDKCERFKPDYKTNADHIRSMTDEELAALLDRFCDAAECRAENGSVCPFYSDCASDHAECDWKVWLKQPYKEDTHD